MRPVSPRPVSRLAQFLALLLAGLLAWQPSTALDYPAMAEAVTQRWGAAGTNRLRNWQGMMQEGLRPDSSEAERLALVNTYFNKNIRFGTQKSGSKRITGPRPWKPWVVGPATAKTLPSPSIFHWSPLASQNRNCASSMCAPCCSKGRPCAWSRTWCWPITSPPEQSLWFWTI